MLGAAYGTQGALPQVCCIYPAIGKGYHLLGSPSVPPSIAAILGRSAQLSERSEFCARPKWREAQGSPQGQTVGACMSQGHG